MNVLRFESQRLLPELHLPFHILLSVANTICTSLSLILTSILFIVTRRRWLKVLEKKLAYTELNETVMGNVRGDVGGTVVCKHLVRTMPHHGNSSLALTRKRTRRATENNAGDYRARVAFPNRCSTPTMLVGSLPTISGGKFRRIPRLSTHVSCLTAQCD